eukprot:5059436-Ditylum_brightwellii.AAC.1
MVSDDIPEGNCLPMLPHDLGFCELYPQMLNYSCNRRFVAVCSNGEFIIYRAHVFGQLLDFVWSGKSTGDYAICESTLHLKVLNSKEGTTIHPATACLEATCKNHQFLMVLADKSQF